DGGGEAPYQEELERGLDRPRVALGESREHVEGHRHQLERDEEQHGLPGGREDEHPEEGGQDEQVVLEGSRRDGRPGEGEAADHRQEGRQQEHPLEKDGQPVHHEGAVEEDSLAVEDEREDEEPEKPRGDDRADLPAALGAGEEPDAEDDHDQARQGQLEGQEHQGSTPSRTMRATTAGSPRERASEGTSPKRITRPDNRTRATHSGPWASARVAYSPCSPATIGPQKIRLATRRT